MAEKSREVILSEIKEKGKMYYKSLNELINDLSIEELIKLNDDMNQDDINTELLKIEIKKEMGWA